MSTAEPERPEEGGEDILAAEFVLGVLSPADQAALARRAATEPVFAQLAAGWEERLLPLAGDYETAALPPAVKRALDLRLFGQPAPRGVLASLGLWRGLAGLATAAFLAVVALFWLDPRGPAQPRLLASLVADASDVHYMALYNPDQDIVGLTRISGAPAPGQDFQLWIARGSEAPVSLGVIPAGASARIALDDQTRPLLGTDAHMAISVEPLGGSPTGQPTGAVVAVGDLYGA